MTQIKRIETDLICANPLDPRAIFRVILRQTILNAARLYLYSC